MNEIVDAIARQSPSGSLRVANQILRIIGRLELFPRSAPPDLTAPSLPQPQAEGRRAVSGNYEIRYAFPVTYRGDDEVVAILFVRDARRDPLDADEIHERFVELVLRDTRDRPG